MKIGLFTIFRCVNFGAVLQAIALKRVLSELFPNATIEVINHLMDPRDNHLLGKVTNPNTPWFQRWRNRSKFQRKFYRADLFEKRREKTICVINEALKPTERLFKSLTDLANVPPYDVIVVGSDQVWNPVLNHDFETNQYLCTTFPAEQRRVSYAASFGVGELDLSVKAEYHDALSQFDVITVREETGARICEELLGVRPEVVVDPTMLLNAKEWQEIFSHLGKASVSGPKDYLFAYWVRTPIQADIDALANIARNYGLPVRLFSAGQLPKLNFPEEVVPQIDVDPIEWAACLSASVGVVTDGFHGLQFAVNFSKPVLALGELSDVRSESSRLTDFCTRCGFPSACAEIDAFRKGESQVLVPTIADNEALINAREKSRMLLKEMIQ